MPLPKWFLSEPLRDRKSLFIGRAIFVTSLSEAKLALNEMKQEKKNAKATHHIWACRIDEKTDEYDDGGEKPAGERLLTFLKQAKIDNVLLVVSRWYGGVKLGGDRFRDIHSCGKQALINGGFLKSS